jgi:hypothetical protein
MPRQNRLTTIAVLTGAVLIVILMTIRLYV